MKQLCMKRSKKFRSIEKIRKRLNILLCLKLFAGILKQNSQPPTHQYCKAWYLPVWVIHRSVVSYSTRPVAWNLTRNNNFSPGVFEDMCTKDNECQGVTFWMNTGLFPNIQIRYFQYCHNSSQKFLGKL